MGNLFSSRKSLDISGQKSKKKQKGKNRDLADDAAVINSNSNSSSGPVNGAVGGTVDGVKAKNTVASAAEPVAEPVVAESVDNSLVKEKDGNALNDNGTGQNSIVIRTSGLSETSNLRKYRSIPLPLDRVLYTPWLHSLRGCHRALGWGRCPHSTDLHPTIQQF